MFTGELRPYQVRPVERMVDRGLFLLTAGVGTGKTPMTIAAVEELHEEFGDDLCGIVVCGGGLKDQWREQISAFTAWLAQIEVSEHMLVSVVMPTCDRITVLNYGQRLADGTPSDIRQHPEVIKAYLGGGITKTSRPERTGALEVAHAAP